MLLRIFSFFIVLIFTCSCGFLFGGAQNNNTDESALKPELQGETVECSGSSRCPVLCKKMFSGEADRLEKCLKLKASDVGEINVAYSSMEKGNFSALKPEYMKILIEFDDKLWIEFAKVNDKTRAKAMLLWVANNKEAAELLDEGDEGDDDSDEDDEGSKILKSAFSVLGAPAGEDRVVIEGMKKIVDTTDRQNFFEVSVFNKNDEAFKAGHILLKAECKNSKSCMKGFYCDIDEDLVFGYLNSLGFGTEIDGGGLYPNECGN